MQWGNPAGSKSNGAYHINPCDALPSAMSRSATSDTALWSGCGEKSVEPNAAGKCSVPLAARYCIGSSRAAATCASRCTLGYAE